MSQGGDHFATCGNHLPGGPSISTAETLHCSFCGNDLSGSSTGRCPECGRPVYRFTERARAVVLEANRQAIALIRSADPLQPAPRWWLPRDLDRAEIAPHHLLLGIIGGPQGVGYHAIRSCGANPSALRQHLLQRVPRHNPGPLDGVEQLPMSPSAWKLVDRAVTEAFQLNHHWVGTEHLLLSLCGSTRWTAVSRALKVMRIDRERVRAFVVANIKRVESSTDS